MSELINYLTKFPSLRILVIGDLMLDKYMWGEVSRISPEAPVPIVRKRRETFNAGGAANVAMNVAGLGAHAAVIGLTGNDAENKTLIYLLNQAGINTEGIVVSKHRPTTLKFRVVGGRQQMLRIDVEDSAELSNEEECQLLDSISAQLTQKVKQPTSAIVISDYGKGVLCEKICQYAISKAKSLGIPVFVDPKGSNYDKYYGATTISPNKGELAMATGVDINDTSALILGGQILRDKLKLEFLTFTRSEQGITIIEENNIQHAPAMAREVFDVSGAGDTVIATMALSLASGLSRLQAIQLANLAAGIVVGKVGTVPIRLAELQASLAAVLPTTDAKTIRPPEQTKILELAQAFEQVTHWRANGEKIVFTNGVFDIIHAGHVTYLEQARAKGTYLILGLNSDASVRRNKGDQRPINSLADRARVLAALQSVDMIVVFEEDTPLNLILALHPDVLVKGADYSLENVIGAKEVLSWGGEVALIPLLEGRSTTNIIAKTS
jgi:D-beta-D-heptose 7-phosphate kinase/D-beta-D-heptose 1-phosphate adenosyltransferase